MKRSWPGFSKGIGEEGFTLIELMVVTALLAVALVMVSRTLIASNRIHERTTQRAEVQMSSRQGMSLMATEIRQAGADSSTPPIGFERFVTASAISVRVRSDLNGDGALQTAEPSEDVTYTYDSVQKAVLRNPGSGAVVVIPNVTAMTLRYFNEAGALLGPLPLSTANRALVRAVEVSITSEERTSRPITLTTRVALRNV